MMRTPNTSHSLKWSWLRHAVQIAALLLFAAPLLVAGWGLFGVSVGGDDPVPAPADLPFFGSLSSSSIGGVTLLDPFGVLQVVAASKTFELDWLWFALPVVVLYGLVRARAFCGWVCPVNLLLELVDECISHNQFNFRSAVLQGKADSLHIQSYVWDAAAADRGEDRPVKEHDHCMDAIRYFVATVIDRGRGRVMRRPRGL